MPASLANNQASREAVLARVRSALGKTDRTAARAQAEAYIAAHAHGPRPAMPADLVGRFIGRATDMQSSVERIADRGAIAPAVARYLAGLDLAPELASQPALGAPPSALRAPPSALRAPPSAPRASPSSKAGVCWPEFADLDWESVGLSVEARPTTGDDRLGITGTFCAIAETGTLVVLTGADTPTATTLLPETHVAVVRADRIVSGMEEAFDLVRRERGRLPRAVNLISGPSRTGDIEQTIVLGAHGPFRVHILVLG